MNKRDVKNIKNNLLKAYLESNKKSMNAFCELMGVSIRSFNYYITGEKIPKYSTLVRIATYLGKEVDDLLM